MKRLKTGIRVVRIFLVFFFLVLFCFVFFVLIFASSSDWQRLEIHWKFKLNFSDFAKQFRG